MQSTALILMALSVVALGTVSAEDVPALLSHRPIYIGGDDQFTLKNGVIGGSGTEDDPYVIAGWEIDAAGVTYAISVEDMDRHFIIRNCKIHGARTFGILFKYVKNGEIESCEIRDNTEGIHLFNSSNNEISGNMIVSNNGAGIGLDEASVGNRISGNKVESNQYDGIYISESKDNLLVRNRIANNGGYGIYMFHSLSHDNRIYHNSFLNNVGNANAYDEGRNHWDNGSQGNYWTDYTGVDADRDGIGDTPYLIPSEENEGNIDRYPLMEPFVAPRD